MCNVCDNAHTQHALAVSCPCPNCICCCVEGSKQTSKEVSKEASGGNSSSGSSSATRRRRRRKSVARGATPVSTSSSLSPTASSSSQDDSESDGASFRRSRCGFNPDKRTKRALTNTIRLGDAQGKLFRIADNVSVAGCVVCDSVFFYHLISYVCLSSLWVPCVDFVVLFGE